MPLVERTILIRHITNVTIITQYGIVISTEIVSFLYKDIRYTCILLSIFFELNFEVMGPLITQLIRVKNILKHANNN